MARETDEDDARPARRKTTRAPRAGTQGTIANHLSGRVDPLTSAILVFPLFVLYQVGILTSTGQNGVDFTTRAFVELCRKDLGTYLVVLGVLVAAYVAVLVLLRQRETFSPRAFLPALAESAFYALTMGSLIIFVMHQFVRVGPGLSTAASSGAGFDPLGILVISAGAGLHEELIFRVIGVSGLAWLFAGLTGEQRAWIIALVVSSFAFSLAHHIGPAGEAFTFAAFVYRLLAGVFFALVYQIRGFAVAVYTHFLYDVYVLSSMAIG